MGEPYNSWTRQGPTLLKPRMCRLGHEDWLHYADPTILYLFWGPFCDTIPDLWKQMSWGRRMCHQHSARIPSQYDDPYSTRSKLYVSSGEMDLAGMASMKSKVLSFKSFYPIGLKRPFAQASSPKKKFEASTKS